MSDINSVEASDGNRHKYLLGMAQASIYWMDGKFVNHETVSSYVDQLLLAFSEYLIDVEMLQGVPTPIVIELVQRGIIELNNQ